mmetsp:Transcript_72502/g.127837  ORF Transcript_72502/g.127837 Transcript_72502/m.127837 type:complete len:92 (-) Transcript_72502:607-882(-)
MGWPSSVADGLSSQWLFCPRPAELQHRTSFLTLFPFIQHKSSYLRLQVVHHCTAHHLPWWYLECADGGMDINSSLAPECNLPNLITSSRTH